MNANDRLSKSSSTVSIRLRVSGPVSFDFLLADAAPTRLFGWVINVCCDAIQQTARAKRIQKFRVLRIVIVFGLFFSIQVIEVAVELIKAVDRRQKLVAIAQVVLADLCCRVTHRFEQFRNRWIFCLNPLRGARHANREQSGTEGVLAEDERRASRSAGLLCVVVSEHDPFFGNSINVRRTAAHQTSVVGADVTDTNVVAPDDQDVGLGLVS